MPPFTLGARGVNTNVSNTEELTPAGGRPQQRAVMTADQGGTGISDIEPDTPEPVAHGGEGLPVGMGHSTRSFPFTYEPSPSVGGPLGPMNVGYTHNVVSDNARWSRGELPDSGYGYAFALRRPRLMREPRTDLGSYNLARG